MSDIASGARRRYKTRIALAGGLYIVVLVAVLWLFNTSPPTGPVRYVLAVAPALPILGIFFVTAQYLMEEADEFRRMTMVQAMLWGLGLALSFSTVWGFLEAFAGAPLIHLYWVFPIYSFGAGVAQPLVGRRYR
ncbi:MAG: hypothetical protein E7812_03170 [Phenylobacterium sp.]|nr:MAG: hypothetical protein E7812_03170 [Phenylobacterium sp.]